MTYVTADYVMIRCLGVGFQRVDHHECGICGEMVSYVINPPNVYFDSECACSTRRPSAPEPRTWEDIAEWINMQETAEAAEQICNRFGFELPDKPSAPIEQYPNETPT